MSKAERRLEQAVRLVPEADRARHEPEWRGDVAAAEQQGLDQDQVSRAARRMAVRLRARQVERVLLGSRSPVAAAAAWVVLLAVVALALLLGNVLLLLALVVLAVVAGVLGRAGLPSHWSHWLMVTSVVTGSVSAAFVWWVAGLKLDAADAMRPEPPVAAWGGTALVVCALSVVGFVVAAAVAAARERSRTH